MWPINSFADMESVWRVDLGENRFFQQGCFHVHILQPAWGDCRSCRRREEVGYKRFQASGPQMEGLREPVHMDRAGSFLTYMHRAIRVPEV